MNWQRNVLYLREVLKALGRIIAAIGLLNFRAAFYCLRIGMLILIGFAFWTIIHKPEFWMLAPTGCAFMGLAFIVWTHRITGIPGSKQELITSGVFAIVRHPMYSSWCLIAISLACIAGHWTMWVLALFQTVFMLSVSCAEEEENIQIFGKDYLDYSQKVWLTGIGIGVIRYIISKMKQWNNREELGEGNVSCNSGTFREV